MHAELSCALKFDGRKSHNYLQKCRTVPVVFIGSSFCSWRRVSPQLNGAAAAQASYSGWKGAAGRYRRMMQNFISTLQDGGLGTWLQKPPELGHFYCSQD